MEKDRLMSYKFNCPCCGEPHKRLFEYFAKFYGMIPEDVPLDSVHTEKSMIEQHIKTDKGWVISNFLDLFSLYI